MAVTIRQAGPEDAELIADLSRQTFVETFAEDNTPENMEKFLSLQFTKEALTKEVTSPGNTFFLALVDDRPAGYARLAVTTENQPETIELKRIYSVKDMIGKGVGKALMLHCLDRAQQMGKKSMVLGVWKKNLRAIQFYTQWGFEKTGEQVFLLGDDPQTDWVMKKDLSAW